MPDQSLHTQDITHDAETGNHSQAVRSGQAASADLFPAPHIAQMDLYAGYPDPGQAVRKGQAGMGVGTWIDDQPLDPGLPGPFQFINKLSFSVGLKICPIDPGCKFRLFLFKDGKSVSMACEP